MQNHWVAKGSKNDLSKAVQFSMLINRAGIQARARLAGAKGVQLTFLLHSAGK